MPFFSRSKKSSPTPAPSAPSAPSASEIEVGRDVVSDDGLSQLEHRIPRLSK